MCIQSGCTVGGRHLLTGFSLNKPHSGNQCKTSWHWERPGSCPLVVTGYISESYSDREIYGLNHRFDIYGLNPTFRDHDILLRLRVPLFMGVLFECLIGVTGYVIRVVQCMITSFQLILLSICSSIDRHTGHRPSICVNTPLCLPLTHGYTRLQAVAPHTDTHTQICHVHTFIAY